MDLYTSQLFPGSPTATGGLQLFNFVSQAGCDTASQAQEEFQGQPQQEVQSLLDHSVYGTQLCQEAINVQQPSVGTALEELEEGLKDLCDDRAWMPRSVILDKLQQNLVAVKLEVHQKQTKINQLEGEKASIVEFKEHVRDEGCRLNVRMIEMTKKLQSENGALIDALVRKFSTNERQLVTLKTQLAEKEKEQHQSSVKINHLQVEVEQLSRATESLKAKHRLFCLRSNEMKAMSETQNRGSLYSKSHHESPYAEQRTTLSLDQRIMKARAMRKQSRMHECNKNYEHELEIELEAARIKSCSLQVDRMLDMQYGEVQKLLLRWKATGSDQITRIWTF